MTKAYYLIIRGPLGSGKSTISKELCKKLKAEHISVDRVLDEHNLTSEWEDGYISQKSFLRANEIIAKRAKELLEKGKSLIFDGNFYWKSQIEDLITRLDYPHYTFTLKVPLEVCIERDSKRAKPHGKDAAEAVYSKSTSFEYGIPIDATQPLKNIIKEITSKIK